MRLSSAYILAIFTMAFLFQLPQGIGPLDRAEGVGVLNATIVLDSQEPNVNVDPQRGGIITYTGTVVTTQPRDFDFQFGILNLEANCSAGWMVTEIPTMTITRIHRDHAFAVSVFVPQFTVATEQDQIHKISIQGTWRYEPGLDNGVIEPIEAFINVNPIYQYSVRSDPGYVQTSPGGEFKIDLIIENTGNGADEVAIAIDRRSTMEDNGWAFVMENTHYTLPYQETIVVPVTISAPQRWDGWRNVISVVRFQVTSSQALQNSDVSEAVFYSVYIRQRGVSIPGFEVPLMVLAVLSVALLSMYRRR